MQSVLVKVTLRADEDVLEEPPEMLAELQPVEQLHGECGLVERVHVTDTVRAVTTPAQPYRHETCRQQYHIREYRHQRVINDTESPLHNRVASFLPVLLQRVLAMADVILVTNRVEHLVRKGVGQDEYQGEGKTDAQQAEQTALTNRSELF